jgi:hypothetical protein
METHKKYLNDEDISHISNQQQPIGEIKRRITSGENLSNGFSFPGIPDGLGAVEIENVMYFAVLIEHISRRDNTNRMD